MAEASDVMRRQGSGVRTTSGPAGHNLSKRQGWAGQHRGNRCRLQKCPLHAWFPLIP
jgi:hypothetical protein